MVEKTKRAKVVASASSCDRGRWQGQADSKAGRAPTEPVAVAPSTGEQLLSFPVLAPTIVCRIFDFRAWAISAFTLARPRPPLSAHPSRPWRRSMHNVFDFV